MILEGILGEYPELRFTPTGKAICVLYVDGVKCIAWEELAESINQHIKVGDKVKVFGYEKERWWTLPNGEKRSAKEFTVNRIQVTERPKPVENCCYFCKHLEIDCMKGCYNALGGPSYMEVCRIEDGRCAEEGIDNRACWELKE